MILQSISLHDTLSISPADTLTLTVEGDVPAGEDNLVLRAARALASATGYLHGARMHLTKRIPVEAGLGGGSTDAAAALRGLNRLWETRLTAKELCAIGARLGADIPFCVVGGTQRATGTGTTLSRLPAPPKMHLVVLRPGKGLLTREVFGALRFDLPLPRPDNAVAIAALHTGDLTALCGAMGNTLEAVTLPKRPASEEALRKLRALGALAAHMSGSGPSVFGVFPDEATAQHACEQLQDAHVCAPVKAYADGEETAPWQA